jgi:hypothetical protein
VLGVCYHELIIETERGMAEHAICDSMKTAGSFDDIVAVPAPSSIAIDEA